MSTRLGMIVSIFLLLTVPALAALAEEIPAISEASAETVSLDAPAVESEPGAPVKEYEFIPQPKFAPQPVPSCTYRCEERWDCPDIIDTPPANCDGGCCNYDVPCEGSCQFDSDCGELASCWSGCCYSWIR